MSVFVDDIKVIFLAFEVTPETQWHKCLFSQYEAEQEINVSVA